MKLPRPASVLLATTLLLSAALVGCGGSSSKTASEPTASPASASATATVAAATSTSTAAPTTAPAVAPTNTPAPAPAAPAPTSTPVPPPPAAPAPTTLSVSIVDFAFSPTSLSARVGQTVMVNVRNTGAAPHSFTIDGGIDSGILNPGQSAALSMTPSQAAILRFYCKVHGAATMSGQIAVTP